MSLFQTLKPKPKASGSGSCCLLLDTSGSMDVSVHDDKAEGIAPRRIDLLFRAVRDTPECAGMKAFYFNSHCMPVETIPDEAHAHDFVPHGSTALDDAFSTVKAAGFYQAILVTDGEPDSEARALQAAAGMKLGIIYIGNPPVPPFLARLAATTDGTFALADMRDIKQLEDALIHALPPPDPTKPPEGGAINL